MPKPKRLSMKGMGADAYFQPASQETSMPAKQQDSTTAEQQATELPNHTIKVTLYITLEQNLKLETIKLQRRKRGEKIDKSGLVREAIDRLES